MSQSAQQTSTTFAVATSEQSLTRRGIETFYTLYFVALIPITLLVDLQAFYPPAVVPQYLKDVNAYYMKTSADPLMTRTLGGPAQMAWYVWIDRSLRWGQLVTKRSRKES